MSRSVPIGAGCCRIVASDPKGSPHNRNSQNMATSNRNGKIRTATASAEALQDANLSGAFAGLPAELQAALKAAQSRPTRARKAPTPRVAVTAAEQATLDAIGWRVPYVDANHTAKPQPRTRQNACKGDAAYSAAAQYLASGNTLKVTELAQLWIACGNDKKPFNALVQQIANRMQRTVKQDGIMISAA